MRIIGINNNLYNTNNIHKTPNFNGKSQDIYTKARRLELLEEYPAENFYDTYNADYEPIEYEREYQLNVKPMTLPSQKYTHYESTFRDEELFDNDNDIKSYYGPETYDIDDVPLDENLWQIYVKNNASEHNYAADTNILSEEIKFKEFVKRPWLDRRKTEENNEEEFERNAMYSICRLPWGNYKLAREIFKSSSLMTNEGIKVNQDLCKLAIDLYKNSEQWTDTEKDIMKNIKIEMYQNNYVDYSKKKYEYVLKCLIMDYENERILNNLKRRFGEGTIDLESIFTKDELKDFM